MRQLITLVMAFSLFGGSILHAHSAASKKALSQQPDASFALLIGINEYIDPKINDLQGTENDVVLMRDLLTDPEVGYQFKRADIKELISSKTGSTSTLPTKANIEKAFRDHLITNAKEFREKNPTEEGATILFYYSGHGSLVNDQKTGDEGKDEANRYDETIVPMDAKKEDGSRDIRDDDINKWFNDLRQYTSNITFIFDSCHSGTMTRGMGNRSIVHTSTAIRMSADRGPSRSTRGYYNPVNENMNANQSYITVSACLPNETAGEDLLPVQSNIGQKPAEKTAPRTQWDGYLTYYLVQTLRQNRGVTYRELTQLVSAAVTKHNTDQTPQVEGDIDRAFLGTKESRNKNAIAIQKIDPGTVSSGGNKIANSIITIEAGRVVGALPGGTVGIYGEKAVQLTGDNDRIATGRIIEAGNYTSKVRVDGKEVSLRSKVILMNPFFTDEKRKVAIDMSGTGSGLEMRKRLKALLIASDYVTPTEATTISFDGVKDWSIAVKKASFAEFKQGRTKSAKKESKTKTDPRLPQDGDEVYYLASPNGNPLYDFYVTANEPDAEEQIREALEKYTKIENLLALNNAGADEKLNDGLKVDLVRLRSCNGETKSFERYSDSELSHTTRATKTVVPGDCFYFRITNDTNKDLYMYLYDISTDGSIDIVYDPPSDGDILVRGNSIETISSGGHILKATEPYGKETLKLIATTKRFDPHLLTQPALAKNVDRGSDSALEALFAQAATNRRSEKIEIPFSGWGTTKIDFEIVPKP